MRILITGGAGYIETNTPYGEISGHPFCLSDNLAASVVDYCTGVLTSTMSFP